MYGNALVSFFIALSSLSLCRSSWSNRFNVRGIHALSAFAFLLLSIFVNESFQAQWTNPTTSRATAFPAFLQEKGFFEYHYWFVWPLLLCGITNLPQVHAIRHPNTNSPLGISCIYIIQEWQVKLTTMAIKKKKGCNQSTAFYQDAPLPAYI